MKKLIKKIFCLSLVLWVIALPTVSGVAQAAQIDPGGGGKSPTYNDAGLEERVRSHLYFNAIGRCVQTADGLDDSADDSDDFDLNQWKIYKSGSVTYISPLYDTVDTHSGNGVTSCSYPQTLYNGFGIWGYATPLNALCYTGIADNYGAVQTVDKKEQPLSPKRTSDCVTALDYSTYTAGDPTPTTSDINGIVINNKDPKIAALYRKVITEKYYGGKTPVWQPEELYWLYSRLFQGSTCGPVDGHKPYGKDNDYVLKTPTAGNPNAVKHYSFDYTHTDNPKISVAWETKAGPDYGEDDLTCAQLLSQANINAAGFYKYLKSHPKDTSATGNPVTAAPTNISTGVTPSDDSSDSSDKSSTCESTGFPLSWIICEGIDLMSRMVDGLFNNVITPLLKTTPLTQGNKSQQIYKTWSSFRVYADVLLVIVLLIVVFGEAIGGGLIDAYTAKKVLPRILIAAILSNVSFYLMAVAVDITNIVGIGMQNLLTTPFQSGGDFQLHVSGATSVAELIGGSGIAWEAGAAAIAAGPELIVALGYFVVLPGVLLALAIAITIFLRQALIIFLVIISPVAFVLYCLPNTEKYFRQWWDLLFKSLLVFPIIAVLFALGDDMGVLIYNVTPIPIVNQLLALLAFFTPLFAIPFAFKLAGGILGRAHDLLSNSGKRMHQGILGNANDKHSLRNRVKRNLGESLSRQQDSRIKAGDGQYWTPRGVRARAYRRLGNVDERLARYNAETREMSEAMSATGRDGLRYAGAGYVIKAGQKAGENVTDFGGKDAGGSVDTKDDRWFDSKGRQIDRQTYNEGKRRYGAGPSGMGQQLEYTLRKAQTSEDIGNMREAFARNAIAEGWDQKEVGDVWAAATFGHKDKWKSEWYSSPTLTTDKATGRKSIQFKDVDTNIGSYDKMIKEFHTVPEQFKLSSIRAQDWHAMGSTMNTLQAKLDSGQTLSTEEAERFTRTSEVMDTMEQQGMVTQAGEGGTYTTSGASAQTQAVIKAMFKTRRYATAALQTSSASGSGPNDTSSEFDQTQRIIYNKAQVDELMGEQVTVGPTMGPAPGGGTMPVGPPVPLKGGRINKEAAIVASAMPNAPVVNVGGDRSPIPPQITP